MKQFIKSAAFFLAGLIIAGILLYFYSSTVFNTSEPDETSLPETFSPAIPGDALITRISGEVYIIRNDEILTPLPGDRVLQGDIIKVVDDSICQIRFAGTASLKIRSNTLVRIQKLLSGTKDADIRTELLTGSMIYKVEELQDSQNLQILAQERIYRVEGTEFMVQALPGTPTVLSVLDGKVAVFNLEENREETLLETLNAGEKTEIAEDAGELSITPFSAEDSAVFTNESPEEIPVTEDGLVFLEVSSIPAGAQIYIDGRLNGYSKVQGLFLPDEELSILVRKRGYSDGSLKVVPIEEENRSIRIELTPLGLEETIIEEENRRNESSVIRDLEEKHRQQLAEMRTSFTQKLSAAESERETLKQSENFLTQENMSLEEELARSREETRKLRDLIRQIQDIAEEEQ